MKDAKWLPHCWRRLTRTETAGEQLSLLTELWLTNTYNDIVTYVKCIFSFETNYEVSNFNALGRSFRSDVTNYKAVQPHLRKCHSVSLHKTTLKFQKLYSGAYQVYSENSWKRSTTHFSALSQKQKFRFYSSS